MESTIPAAQNTPILDFISPKTDLENAIHEQVEIETKYVGYITRQRDEDLVDLVGRNKRSALRRTKVNESIIVSERRGFLETISSDFE